MLVQNSNSEQMCLVSPQTDFRTGAHNPFHAVAWSRHVSASALNDGLIYFLQLATNCAVTIWQVNFIDTSTLFVTERSLDRIPQHLIQENETHIMFRPVFRTYYIGKTGRTRRSCKDNETDIAVLQLQSVSSGKFIKLRHFSRLPNGTANEETGKDISSLRRKVN
jgi:hypothetical protein